MPFCLKFFAISTINQRENQAIKLADHTHNVGLAPGYLQGQRILEMTYQMNEACDSFFFTIYYQDKDGVRGQNGGLVWPENLNNIRQGEKQRVKATIRDFNGGEILFDSVECANPGHIQSSSFSKGYYDSSSTAGASPPAAPSANSSAKNNNLIDALFGAVLNPKK